MYRYSLEYIRSQIIGGNVLIDTPFGERHLFYADYTASGRGLQFIEDKIFNIMKSYANTHTEDDYTGKYMTTLLHQAEEKIKALVNAGPNGKIISVGSGTTGALLKLLQILGVYLPPLTRENFQLALKESGNDQIIKMLEEKMPVIFISPYEHHTNELMWRESYAKVVVIQMDGKGKLDLKDLESKLSSKEYSGRKKMASFSAGSNITGLRTQIYDVARLCHKYDTPILYDFAAIAPYTNINMNRDEDSYFDAIVFSPHKFIGGPGSAGVLIFNEKLYRKDLPPTAAGGGTVDYVGYRYHDFIKDIETREKAGTPPILGTIKTALVMELKEKIGVDRIESIEHQYANRFLDQVKNIDGVELIGDIAVEDRVPIISFNVRHKDRYLHPKFVTKLLNDLFGIQSRAGCSCAGPYGHYLLGIDEKESDLYRKLISEGHNGVKPGWVRVNLHFTFEEKDIDFLVRAITFVAEYGHLFLHEYRLEMETADWTYVGLSEATEPFSIDDAFETKEVNLNYLDQLRESYFKEARQIAELLEKKPEKTPWQDPNDVETVKFFYHYK